MTAQPDRKEVTNVWDQSDVLFLNVSEQGSANLQYSSTEPIARIDVADLVSKNQEQSLNLDITAWNQLGTAPCPGAAQAVHPSYEFPKGGPATRRKRQRGQIWRYTLSDGLAISIAIAAALIFRPAAESLSSGLAIVGGLLVGLLWLGVLSAGEPRAVRRSNTGVQQARRAIRTSIAFFGALAVFAVVTGWESGKWYLLVSLPIGVFFMVAFRWLLLRRHARRGSPITSHTQRVLLIGSHASTQQWSATLEEQGHAAAYQVAGTLSLGDCGCADQRVDDDVSAIVDAATRTGVDAVILSDSAHLSPAEMRELGWRLTALDISLLYGTSLQEVTPGRLWVESVEGLPLIHVEYPRLQGVAAMKKRCFDVIFACAALVVVIPVVTVVGLAVALESRGPILFRQKRVGLDHRLFTMLKIRSMSQDAEAQKAQLQAESEGNEVLFKMRDDPRVTRVGRIIRRLSIDELPQFFNVLTGDMSVVGPRPPLPTETESYDDTADRRMTVKPGITGPWQIGGRSDLSWEQSLRLDTYYVENWSLTGDLLIVIKTVRAVFRGSGAY